MIAVRHEQLAIRKDGHPGPEQWAHIAISTSRRDLHRACPRSTAVSRVVNPGAIAVVELLGRVDRLFVVQVQIGAIMKWTSRSVEHQRWLGRVLESPDGSREVPGLAAVRRTVDALR